jgi:phasin family protein
MQHFPFNWSPTMMTPEQFAAANKANLDALVELTRKSFEGVEKLVALNLQAMRCAMGDSAERSKALLAVKDAKDLASLQAHLVQPSAEQVTTYSRQVYDIASSTQSEVSRLVESQMAMAQEKILALVDAAVKNAPAGGEASLAMIKQAVTAANGALENVQKAAKQALSVAETNFESMGQTAPAMTPPAEEAVRAPRKR